MMEETKEYTELRRSIYVSILGTLIARYDGDPDWSKKDIVIEAWDYADWAAEFEFKGFGLEE